MHNAQCFNSPFTDVPPKSDLFWHHFEVYLAHWLILNSKDGLFLFCKVYIHLASGTFVHEGTKFLTFIPQVYCIFIHLHDQA